MHDDGFHEIQLNGKQLVFLFMAATVVSVVIFLIGVMVGRSVGETRASAAETAALDDVPEPELPAASGSAAEPPPAGSDPTKAPAPTSVEDLSYFNRLESGKPPVETDKPPPAKPAAPSTPPATASSRGSTPPAPVATPPPAKPSAPAPAPSSPTLASNEAVAPGQGWVVQIASLTAVNEANAMAKRWTSKGYRAYVQRPGDGAPNSTYRVRIGPYKTRAEALAAEAKLQKEGQATTWVTPP
jgi:DedD protein